MAPIRKEEIILKFHQICDQHDSFWIFNFYIFFSCTDFNCMEVVQLVLSASCDKDGFCSVEPS